MTYFKLSSCRPFKKMKKVGMLICLPAVSMLDFTTVGQRNEAKAIYFVCPKHGRLTRETASPNSACQGEEAKKTGASKHSVWALHMDLERYLRGAM